MAAATASLQDDIVTISDLFMSKVHETPNAVFLRYPATTRGKSDYVDYTVSDIDRLADDSARQYLSQGLHPEVSRSRHVTSHDTASLLLPKIQDSLIYFPACSGKVRGRSLVGCLDHRICHLHRRPITLGIFPPPSVD